MDRISKYLIIKEVAKTGKNKIYESTYVNLELIWNKGIAFGLLSFSSSYSYNIISFVIFIIIIILLIFIFRTKSFEKICFVMITGGAIGNLYDRVFFRSVPDFIDLHINNFHWFIFNIADIFITIGVVGLIYFEIYLKKKDV